MPTNGMTIDGLNTVSSLTAQDKVPVWDNESSGEPTRKITAQNMANSVKTLGNLVNTTEMNTAIAQSTATLQGEIDTIGALKSVVISNTSLNRVYRYIFGSAVIIYGLVAFISATAEISGLPTNGSGDYVPVSLFDIDVASTKFFNLNPNSTTVSLTGLTSSHYYMLMCVYSMK